MPRHCHIMQWQDEGILLNMREHGEGHAVAEILTRDHGRHLGLVRGGHSRRMRPLLQAGNTLSVSWNARLEQHLGNYTLDLLQERAGRWLHDAAPLHALSVLSAHLHHLAEREPHAGIYDALTHLLDQLSDKNVAQGLFIEFELLLLNEFGFGLDLSCCAVTGAQNGLTHVSPRTGRAVCAAEAAPYADRLLQLPAFLCDGETDSVLTPEYIAQGEKLTGFFLAQHLYGVNGQALPQARASFFRV